MIETELKLDSFYHTEALKEIKGAVFDYSKALREALLLELPKFVECNQGKCSERETLAPYLRSRKTKDTHFPFAGLE